MLGGDERTRTADPLLAKQMLSQLSYIPAHGLQSMLIAVARRHLPPHAVLASPREVLQTLNGLKSGKDKALVDLGLFVTN